MSQDKHVLKTKPDHAGIFLFKCPACGFVHPINISHPLGRDGKSVWQFNGNLEKPTFNLSIRVQGMLPMSPSQVREAFKNQNNPQFKLPQQAFYICHSYITDGKIKFLDECTHQHKGQTHQLEKF